MSFENFIQQTESKKHLLATIEAKEKLKLFTLVGVVYEKTVNFFVVGVSVNGTNLTQGGSTSLSAGQWFYDPTISKLYVRLSDNSDPKASSLYATYRLFFSNLSANAPHNVTSGTTVHYDARIERIGGLKLELDFENTGIALETDSSIQLENNDGFFDDLFDTLIFENNRVQFYSWNDQIAFSDARLIYRGFIADKSFSSQAVGFTLKDELSVLRQQLPVTRFSNIDGRIEDSVIGTPKRIIFGRVDNIRTMGVDKILDGFPLTGMLSGSADRNLLSGTVSGTAGGSTITGLDTAFTSQVNPGDRIRVFGVFDEYVYTVSTVGSNTSLTISGTISVTFSGFQARNLNVRNNRVTGSGTSFLAQTSPGDELKVTVSGIEYSYKIESVSSNTELFLEDEIEVSFTNASLINLPEIPYRAYNRRWHIAGHRLRQFNATITAIVNQQFFEVDNPQDIQRGDSLKIGSFTYTVRVITGNQIIINQNFQSVVNVGATVTKIPVTECLVDGVRLFIDRDFTLNNSSTDAVIEFNNLAEFNAAPTKSLNVTFVFTSGNRTLAPSGFTGDLTQLVKPRDWIRARTVTTSTWYEVLRVEPQLITLRTSIVDTVTTQAQLKNPSFISDASLVTVDTLGLESGGVWIRTPSDAVKYILESAGLTSLNSASFTEAKGDCDYDLALYYPTSYGGEAPNLREVVSDINNSVFGSLYLDSSFQYTFKILNADKPVTMPIIKDEDIISFRVQTKTNTINEVQLSYSPYVDTEKRQETFKTVTIQSDFVNQAIGKKQLLQVKSYLYSEQAAETMAQRWLFFRSLTQSVITITAKLQYTLLSLNQPMLLDLSRLFKRFGSATRRKIGLINSITKDGANTVIQINDLGNVFSRVPAIAPNTTGDYTQGSDDLDRWGYIVDNLTETPDPASEAELGANLIG